MGNGINTGFAISKYNAVVCVTVIAFAAAFAALGNTRQDVVEGHKVGSDAVVHGDEGLPHRWDGDIGGDGDQFVAFTVRTFWLEFLLLLLLPPMVPTFVCSSKL